MKIKVKLTVKKSTGEIEERFFNFRPNDQVHISDPEADDLVVIELVKVPWYYRIFSKFLKLNMNIVLNTKKPESV